LATASEAIGVVTGLVFEARDVAQAWGAGAPPLRTGLGAAALGAAEDLVAAGARGLVSLGLAGGLAPGLTPGTVVVATTVVHATGSWRLATAERLAGRLDAVVGALHTAPAPLLTVADKRRARARTAAVVVDMESAHVLTVAARCGVGALVVRVVADPAARALPRVARVAVRPDGRLDPWATASALLRYPADWPHVAVSGRDTARARAGLRRAAAGLARLARQGLLERLFDVPIEDVGGGPLLG
jgi:hypothetical protein